MQRYLDPKNDVAFKKVFGTKEHKPLLISFLNAVLRLRNGRQIDSLELLPQEEVPQLPEQRRSIFDVRCKDKAGNQFIVEMQNHVVPEFVQRVQFYAAHAYSGQLTSGAKFMELKPIVLLSIMNCNFFKEKEGYLHYHKIMDTKTFENDLKDISFAFIELHKFGKSIEESVTMEDKWIYFLKHAQEATEPAFNEPELIEAYRTLERFVWTPSMLDLYLKTEMFDATLLRAEELKYQKGKEEGIEIGREEGIEIGREEGIEIGMRATTFEIARNLIQSGLDNKTIEKATGLSAEEIQNLRK